MTSHRSLSTNGALVLRMHPANCRQARAKSGRKIHLALAPKAGRVQALDRHLPFFGGFRRGRGEKALRLAGERFACLRPEGKGAASIWKVRQPGPVKDLHRLSRLAHTAVDIRLDGEKPFPKRVHAPWICQFKSRL